MKIRGRYIVKGGKTYLQPFDMVLEAILDAGGLQKGEMSYSDTAAGQVGFKILMYGEEIEYRFSIADTWNRCCVVTIELADDIINAKRLINHEFALIDYMLIDKMQVEIAEQEEWDKRIAAQRGAE